MADFSNERGRASCAARDLCVMPKVEVGGWRMGMKTVNQEFQPERDKFHMELERLLRGLAAERRLLEVRTRNPALELRCGETAEAQAVLAAQQRLLDGKRPSHARQWPGPQRANSKTDNHGNARFSRRATL